MSLNGTAWIPIGPSPISEGSTNENGLVSSIAINPNNPNIIYMGTVGGGVWRTNDGGNHWRPLFDRQIAPGQLIGFAEDHGPGEEEGDFHVEDHEQQRDHVEAEIELHPGTADGRLAALVDGELFRLRLPRPQEHARHQMHENEADADHQEEQQVDDEQLVLIHEGSYRLSAFGCRLSNNRPIFLHPRRTWRPRTR